MTQIHIKNRVQNDFGMVPRALWLIPDLSSSAKLCAAYLFCLPDGAAPFVAKIEKDTGLGRDARRKAFAELVEAKIIEWEYLRDDAQRIISKTLVIDHLPVVIAGRATENQAVGKSAPDGSLAPDIPAGGSSTPAKAVSRPYSDCGSGDNLRKEKEKRTAAKVERAANARSAPRRSPVARPMVGGSVGSGRVVESETDSKRPADPWQRASTASALGLQWVHPDTGLFHAASEFPKIAEKGAAL